MTPAIIKTAVSGTVWHEATILNAYIRWTMALIFTVISMCNDLRCFLYICLEQRFSSSPYP